MNLYMLLTYSTRFTVKFQKKIEIKTIVNANVQ